MSPAEAVAVLRAALATDGPCQGPDEWEAIDALDACHPDYCRLLWTMLGEQREVMRRHNAKRVLDAIAGRAEWITSGGTR